MSDPTDRLTNRGIKLSKIDHAVSLVYIFSALGITLPFLSVQMSTMKVGMQFVLATY